MRAALGSMGSSAWETAQLRGGLCMTGYKRLLNLQTAATANLQLHAFSSQRGERLRQKVHKNLKAQPQTQARFLQPDVSWLTRDTLTLRPDTTTSFCGEASEL